jgi:DNA-directed RNA polymerase subunit L
MQLNVLEQEKNKLKIELRGETATITQLIAKQAWKEGGEAAGIREHPFMEEPKIVVEGSNPKKILADSAKAVDEQCDEFKEELARALKA